MAAPTYDEKERLKREAAAAKAAAAAAGSSLSDPAAQAAEAANQRAAAAAAQAESDYQAGVQARTNATNDEVGEGAIAGAVADFGEGAWNAIDDAFSAETVGGPAPGNWGKSGTAAAVYNAQQAARGANVQQGAVDAGAAQQADANAAGLNAATESYGVANDLLQQSGAARDCAAPVTDYSGANNQAVQAQRARGDVDKYTQQAGNASQQQQQLAALNRFAQGPAGPSAAQAQLAAGSDAAQASALSMARSGRGGGDSASALRDATFSNAATQAQAGQAAAQLRAQEEATHRQQQLQALDAAMGGAGAIRGADTAVAQIAQGTRGQDLQAQQQAAAQSQFDTQTQQQSTAQNDAANLGLLNASLGYVGEGNQTNLGFQSLGAQTNLGYNQLGQSAAVDYAQLGQNALNSQADYELAQQQMAIDAAKANQQADLEKDSGVTGLFSAVGGAIFSDERVKKDVRRPSEAEQHSEMLSKALSTVGNAPAYSYKYKDPGQPGAKAGRMVGPMAQDLERGPLGDTLVVDTPRGKMVDTGRLSMLNSGAITALNDNDDDTDRRLEALERALGRKAA